LALTPQNLLFEGDVFSILVQDDVPDTTKTVVSADQVRFFLCVLGWRVADH